MVSSVFPVTGIRDVRDSWWQCQEISWASDNGICTFDLLYSSCFMISNPWFNLRPPSHVWTVKHPHIVTQEQQKLFSIVSHCCPRPKERGHHNNVNHHHGIWAPHGLKNALRVNGKCRGSKGKALRVTSEIIARQLRHAAKMNISDQSSSAERLRVLQKVRDV